MIDPTTLAEIWDVHIDRLLLIARSMGEPAEDAVQEAFIALATQSQLPDDPMAWLVRVTRNRLLQVRRSSRRRRARETRAGNRCWFGSETLRLDEKLDAREVTEALTALPRDQREVIVMHLWGEMTFESIARVTGRSRATAHRVFCRGLENLKRRFNSESQLDSIRL